MPFTISSNNKWPVVIPDATASEAGVMSPAQVQKLDSLGSTTLADGYIAGGGNGGTDNSLGDSVDGMDEPLRLRLDDGDPGLILQSVDPAIGEAGKFLLDGTNVALNTASGVGFEVNLGPGTDPKPPGTISLVGSNGTNNNSGSSIELTCGNGDGSGDGGSLTVTIGVTSGVGAIGQFNVESSNGAAPMSVDEFGIFAPNAFKWIKDYYLNDAVWQSNKWGSDLTVSANTVTPANGTHLVAGVGKTIQTISTADLPTDLNDNIFDGLRVTLVAKDADITVSTGGNISINFTLAHGGGMTFVYKVSTSTWYPTVTVVG